MEKRFKLRLSLPSFHLCRSKRPSTFPKSPSPAATYLFSPFNPKSLEIAYPNFPDPPPTTPTHTFFKRPVASSKITPFTTAAARIPSKPYMYTTHKMHTTPILYDSDDNKWPITPPPETTSIFTPSRSFGSSYEETESSFSATSRSFDSVDTINGTFKTESVKVQKMKRYASNSWSTITNSNNSKVGGGGGKAVAVAEVEMEKKSVFRRLLPGCGAVMLEGKVRESVAVVKTSDDPYEDFKRSMLEMILEKEMYGAKDLEQLLQCFLLLNSRHHHRVIVAVFTEIWQVLFP